MHCVCVKLSGQSESCDDTLSQVQKCYASIFRPILVLLTNHALKHVTKTNNRVPRLTDTELVCPLSLKKLPAISGRKCVRIEFYLPRSPQNISVKKNIKHIDKTKGRIFLPQVIPSSSASAQSCDIQYFWTLFKTNKTPKVNPIYNFERKTHLRCFFQTLQELEKRDKEAIFSAHKRVQIIFL